MADDNAVISVVHQPTGEVHNISIPPDTPVSDLHDALINSGYNADIEKLDSELSNVRPPQWAPTPYSTGDFQTGKSRPGYGPSKEGVVENSPQFKEAAKAIWKAANEGRNPNEAATTIDKNTERGPIVVGDQEGHMSMVVPADATSQLHTHPNHFQGQQAGGQPSQTDIATAKKLGKNVYVVSKSGLQMVDKYGKVTSIYNNSDWMTSNNK
jgi:hypothetical protein